MKIPLFCFIISLIVYVGFTTFLLLPTDIQERLRSNLNTDWRHQFSVFASLLFSFYVLAYKAKELIEKQWLFNFTWFILLIAPATILTFIPEISKSWFWRMAIAVDISYSLILVTFIIFVVVQFDKQSGKETWIHTVEKS